MIPEKIKKEKKPKFFISGSASIAMATNRIIERRAKKAVK